MRQYVAYAKWITLTNRRRSDGMLLEQECGLFGLNSRSYLPFLQPVVHQFVCPECFDLCYWDLGNDGWKSEKFGNNWMYDGEMDVWVVSEE